MNDGSTPGYRHTQNGPWSLLLYLVGVLMLGLGWLLREVPVVPGVLPLAGTIMLLFGASFQQLTVSDRGDRLAVRFGPLPLFGTSVRYEDIDKAEVGQTMILDGWGIHMSLRGGWVWNIWGWDCLVVQQKNGRVLRIGTDDAENLARFVQSKIAPRNE